MSKNTKPVSEDYFSQRIRVISERYPPEDVRIYLRMQRRWIRRVTQMSDISPIQRIAVLFIGAFCTPSKPFCFASMDYICKHVGCERSSITRGITELEKRGYMHVDRLKRGGNVYRIMVPV